MTTAIQQDVEKEVQDEIIVGNQDRIDALADIAARSREERDKELMAEGHEVIDTSTSAEENKEETEVKEEDKEDVKEELKEEKQEQKPEIVKIKVDGQEQEVTLDKILDAGKRTLQKESSADKRLEEATRLLREIETKYAQPKQESPSQEWDDNTIAEALEHGTTEQKAYAISLIRGRSNATPEQLTDQVASRVLDTVDFRNSAEWFSTEYKDIVDDPYLLQLASMAEDKARAVGDNRSRRELYKEIGDNLRKWKGGTTAPASFEAKKEQKSTIVNLPTASIKKSAPEPQKAKSTSDVIEDMRKARGQN